MAVPRVTVLMPVYNALPYLQAALDSILAQSFTGFEFLIVDDCSTDGSWQLLEQYARREPRIVLHRNPRNLGVVATLNRGVALARGDYVARMDADDVSRADRLARQAAYLDAHPDVALVAARIEFIGANGEPRGVWAADQEATLPDEIRRALPSGNCIAHPSVMLRRSVALAYPYWAEQRHAEDYDLWLRLCADGHRLAKIDDVLLKYRVHSQSVTVASNRDEGLRKYMRVKRTFLSGRLRRGRFGAVEWGVLRTLPHDGARHAGRLLRARVRSTAEHWLARCGQLAARFERRRNPSSLYFFFPFYSTGGAERVHAAITACFADLRPWIVITNQSRNSTFLTAFRRAGPVLEAEAWLSRHPQLNHRVGRWLLASFNAGRFAAIVNRDANAVVFGANSNLYYRLLPHLQPHVHCVDLMHAFGGGLEDSSLPVAARLDRRVVISDHTRDLISRQYGAHGLPSELVERVVAIENGTDVPAELPAKTADARLQVLFVGRNSPEKRVHLVGRIALECRRRDLPVYFTLIGDVGAGLTPEAAAAVNVIGEVVDAALLAGYYRAADVLLLVSSREGFPLVIMEGMAQGVVPIATDVGGIALHVHDGQTGFLVPNTDESRIVDSAVTILQHLSRDRVHLRQVSAQAHAYARAHFGGEQVCGSYRTLLLLAR